MGQSRKCVYRDLIGDTYLLLLGSVRAWLWVSNPGRGQDYQKGKEQRRQILRWRRDFSK